MMRIESFINRKVVVLREDSPVREASFAMSRAGVGSVVVYSQKGHMVGIATDRDIACSLGPKAIDANSPLSLVMTSVPITVTPDATLEQIIALMKNHHIRRVPVVESSVRDGHHKVVGIIALDDLIMTEQIDRHDLAAIVAAQVGQREQRLPGRPLRSKIRVLNVKNHFVKSMGEGSHLSNSERIIAVHHLFAAITRRLHYAGAAQFIAQLPKDFHDELEGLRAGPDRHVTAEWAVQNLAAKLRRSDQEAAAALARMWNQLIELTDKNEMLHVFHQLPLDWKHLLVPETHLAVIGPKALASYRESF